MRLVRGRADCLARDRLRMMLLSRQTDHLFRGLDCPSWSRPRARTGREVQGAHVHPKVHAVPMAHPYLVEDRESRMAPVRQEVRRVRRRMSCLVMGRCGLGQSPGSKEEGRELRSGLGAQGAQMSSMEQEARQE